ncbi:metallophosphoesterase [Aliihoeflea sp. 2WW]|uniref:metallophosphoesterase n=1 Tax=Aliihoeflea sp. 2WW TaxID=1381123 RepID=UPI0004660A5F|nr:metallophosphoesterase [Aliihoeflea sp. 2WW]
MSAFTRKFYVSDTHFGHEAILGFCNRPFSSVKEMDEFMVDRWNSVVRDTDIVYHLGDFSFGCPERAVAIHRRLKGRKYLILGNHDLRRGDSVLPHILRMEWERPPVLTASTSDGGNRLFLSHYGHRTWPGQNRGSYHFYGHSHASIPHLGLSRDVGVDCADVAFTPRTFHELTAALPGLTSAVTAA